ncbi:hypothetical protein PLICRDRAFT_43634 [Plicaturopsis crispa FD-325 SS-3]|nr:hypothetical protein PLICRDRAFT_43634 [Plicaturopsis crispa FD-325 SS-3]
MSSFASGSGAYHNFPLGGGAVYQGGGASQVPTQESSVNPIYFILGQFPGCYVRAELTEIQQAKVGRKYARVDRRPIDPPPVALLRLFIVVNPGTHQQYEHEVENYDDVRNIGLLCHVDLFPVPGTYSSSAPTKSDTVSTGSDAHEYTLPLPSAAPLSFPPDPLHRLPRENQAEDAAFPGPSSYTAQQTTVAAAIAYIDGYPITEDIKCTTALAGVTFVQPELVEYLGKKALLFVFADLAAKTEGNFILRYRVFDIFLGTQNSTNGSGPMLAECYGGRFTVYSTKDFPGLPPSTELTKQLSRFGVRLHVREVGRKGPIG